MTEEAKETLPIIDILLRFDPNNGTASHAVLGVDRLPLEEMADYLESYARELRRMQTEALRRRLAELEGKNDQG